MFGRNRKERKRLISRGEEFDSADPLAGLLRGGYPGEAGMRPEARRRMLDRLLALQRSGTEPERSPAGRKWKYALIPAVAAACAIALVISLLVLLPEGPEPMVPNEYFATVDSPAGEVRAHLENGESRLIRQGDELGRGCAVRTGDDSFAAVKFPDGSVMRVTDGSEARIEELTPRSVKVEHVSGSTYHRVNKGSEYVVSNSGIDLHALGTAFNVETRVPGNLEILTVESAVEVEIGEHEPIEVVEGEVLVVDLSEEKKAAKQPVSRDRLEEVRLRKSAKLDADEGYDTGIYDKLDVPLEDEGEKAAEEEEEFPGMELGGEVTEEGVSLNWGVSVSLLYDSVVLLRSGEATKPVYPENEIARYSDTEITSGVDDSVKPGMTYQYRVAALLEGKLVRYSNTIVISVPEQESEPEQATVKLVAFAIDKAVELEWSVKGAEGIDGYVLERVVLTAPKDSDTPSGTTERIRIDSGDILYSYRDEAVKPNHEYSYRVGLVVKGSVMVYSNEESLSVPPRNSGASTDLP